MRLTQAKLGEAVGLSQSAISLIERGKLVGVTLRTIGDICDVLGIRAAWQVTLPFLSGRNAEAAATDALEGRSAGRQRDAAHARCSGRVRRRLERAGWIVLQEVEIVLGRTHGWIDLLAYHPARRTLLIGEIKTELYDIGELQRTLAWYEREAWAVARRLGWEPTLAMTCLFTLATVANDDRIESNREILAQAFPIRSRTMRGWLDDPTEPLAGERALVMIDPVSRQHAWLRATRVDGRRRPARYLDYRDFMLHASTGSHARIEGDS